MSQTGRVDIKCHLSGLYHAVTVLFFVMGLGSGYECGGFIAFGSPTSGSITSPNYPDSYPIYARCIWILEAPSKSVVQLTVTFTGESYNGSCSDFIQVYDGGTSSTKLVDECGTLTSFVVTTTSRWMYLFFASDGFPGKGTGLNASYTSVYTGVENNTISSPVQDCRSYQFTCANKLCLSMSYRCDGYNDCGCGSDCDEDDCGGLPMNNIQQIVIGVAVGVGVFVVVAFLGVILEKHHNWENQRQSSFMKPQGASQYKETTKSRTGWASVQNKNVSNAATVSSPTPSFLEKDTPRSDIKVKVTEVV